MLGRKPVPAPAARDTDPGMWRIVEAMPDSTLMWAWRASNTRNPTPTQRVVLAAMQDEMRVRAMRTGTRRYRRVIGSTRRVARSWTR